MKMFELLPRPLGSIFRKLTHLTCNSRSLRKAMPAELWYNYAMKFGEIAERLGGTIVVENNEGEITSAYTSDLLSDVMGHCGDESVLITIQNHLNAIAVCTLAGIEGIVLCHDRQPPEDMVEASRREGIGIMTTSLSQFEVSVKLADLRPSTKF